MNGEIIPLQFVPAGHTAQVAEVCGNCPFAERLREMGICPGCQLKVVSQGTSCVVRTGGSKICFRDNEATQVLVCVGLDQ